MNRDKYREAFNAVPFSEDFQQRTVERLTRNQGDGKDEFMRATRRFKALPIVAALAAILTISAAAVVLWLTPSETAQMLDDPLLAEAFESEDAIILDQTTESGGYTFRLAGVVSGEAISDHTEDLDEEKTYVVASLSHTDGTPIEEAGFDFVFTPLVAGYQPRIVNTWTLGGGANAFVHEGVAYYLYEFETIEKFADSTVYFAMYEGGVPGPDTFSMAEDGSISFVSDYDGPHALFTIPLDESKADPEAVDAFFNKIGFEP